jgi:FdhD protein
MNRNTLVVPVNTVENSGCLRRDDLLAVEEPLEIRLNGSPVSVTMRTPGDDADLAVGFLFTEGIIANYEDIESIETGTGRSRSSSNTIRIKLRSTVEVDSTRLKRHSYASSSCGVCGRISIDSIFVPPERDLPKPRVTVRIPVVHHLPNQLRASQSVFNRTGGLHAAGLFTVDGTMLALREDIGRHNAVDKLIGYGVAGSRLPLCESLMLISGRAGFEVVQKAAVGGIPILAAVGAPSSLAVETARRFGMTLLGFVRENRFNSYSGDWRIG